MITKIDIEVCSKDLDDKIDNRYRLYLNNDILIERKWKLDPWFYIDEEIWVDLDIGTHTLKLEHCHPTSHPFYFRNPRISYTAYNILESNDYSLIFNS